MFCLQQDVVYTVEVSECFKICWSIRFEVRIIILFEKNVRVFFVEMAAVYASPDCVLHY